MRNNRLSKLEDIGFFITIMYISVLVGFAVIAAIGKIVMLITK